MACMLGAQSCCWFCHEAAHLCIAFVTLFFAKFDFCEGLQDICQTDRNFLPDPGQNKHLPVLSDSPEWNQKALLSDVTAGMILRSKLSHAPWGWVRISPTNNSSPGNSTGMGPQTGILEEIMRTFLRYVRGFLSLMHQSCVTPAPSGEKH